MVAMEIIPGWEDARVRSCSPPAARRLLRGPFGAWGRILLVFRVQNTCTNHSLLLFADLRLIVLFCLTFA